MPVKKSNQAPIKIAGITVGPKLTIGEVRQISRQTDLTPAQIQARAEKKADTAGLKIGTAASTFFANKTAPPSNGSAGGTTNGGPSFSGGGVGAGGITSPEFEAGKLGAELQNRAAISNYGWDTQKAMENIRQAAETERLKYEVDNRIPVVQAEAKGKIDLQKIVNSGYQNIARIERGSDMFRSIMGAFNF